MCLIIYQDCLKPITLKPFVKGVQKMNQEISRRNFMKYLGLLTASAVLPWELSSPRSLLANDLRKAILGEVNYKKPAVSPKVIMIFLYGGPSELAGNLTNIAEINAKSQNKYPDSVLPGRGDFTANSFWRNAGGSTMESLIASKDLSIYRTINRIHEDNKAHEPSILQNLIGSLTMDGPGIATTLAAILSANNAFSTSPVLPFVSFEGESAIFRPGDIALASALKAISLDSNFRNPYERSTNSSVGSQDSIIEKLSRDTAKRGTKYEKMNEAFDKRVLIDTFIKDNFSTKSVSDAVAGVTYPDTNFGRHLKAAMVLSVKSPDTLFISLGSGGLGGWDDHGDAIRDYTPRMEGLMQAINVAVQHMKILGRNDIMINVFGDFGRNVNLNNSIGWDHGNNQNFYTIGGSAIRPANALGKIVGKTKLIGTAFQNRQFTSPESGSYQCEPFAIASSLYKYFGVQNPEILTGEAAINEVAPANEKKV